MLIIFFRVSLKTLNQVGHDVLPIEVSPGKNLSVLCNYESFVIILFQPFHLLDQI